MIPGSKVVVTGGAGFIGSHLVEILVQSNYKVTIIDNLVNGKLANLKNINSSNFEFFELDITKANLADALQGAHTVFHLAGIGDVIPSINYPEKYFETNTLGSVRLFAECQKSNVRKIVYASSSSCYGNAEIPTNENAPISLLHPYAASKFFGEQVLFSLGKVYGLPITSVCIFNAYGRRFKTSGAYGSVIGVFLKQALEKQPLTIAGDGLQTRDFVHVSDVAKAFLAAAIKGHAFKRYNIGQGKGIKIKTLADLISTNQIYIPDRLGEARHTLADYKLAELELNWKPTIPIEEGISELIENLNEWSDAPLWTRENILSEVSYVSIFVILNLISRSKY